ncbi:tripartite tricarboxylate transporter permease [Billgrantia sulfidoxydans]|uniref:Tripartite tricarboxylate transporter permease n=1 Tax=Billgrantia sulfidoxydans TaxID=2733484 RepID=A0ABX7W8R3_9GAMM|nr:tripartite tricarboxylate transporter permease [Halomonas sulfidoxydans]QTP56102.1 tripartite tricarboxylate transporter permease [Halomonas sulfidoxydans]
MFENIVSALDLLFQPVRLLALFVGMLAGMIFGMLPGLGGVAAVSILLPFIYLMDGYAGLAMLLGAISVIYTADTITSVLLGAPGSPASAPTAIEGHALAKQGKASLALGVGFLASMVGGLFGALILSVAIPVAGPLVLALGTPELFMFALVGLCFAASMVGKDLAVGLAAACFGILLGVVGAAPAAANYRFIFGQSYLMDGLSLPIVALGLFAVAELIGMVAAGGGIAGKPTPLGKWSDSFCEFWRHRWLVCRASVIGIFGGFVPAVGASASTWIAYGHALSSTKDKRNFGKGEIRGVASAEGANNATIISDLVPTMLFSVPGGPAAAIFLGALFSFGFYPGPRMVSESPDLMYMIVWSVALASVLGAAICFAVTPYIARLTRVNFALIAAPLLLIMVAGAYQGTRTFGDILALLALGILGWLMKNAGVPRAPVLVGFVLATPMEQYFWLTTQIHGFTWLTRPGVLIIASLIVIPLVLNVVRRLRQRWSAGHDEPQPQTAADGGEIASHDSSVVLVMVLLMVAVFGYALVEMLGFRPNARLMPSLGIVPGLLLSLYLLGRQLVRMRRQGAVANLASRKELPVLGGILLYGIAMWLIGFNLATPLLLAWLLIGCARMRWNSALLYGLAVYAVAQGMFAMMRSTPPQGVLLNLPMPW